MGIENERKVLLVDLDGVLVLEFLPAGASVLELYNLCPNIADVLRRTAAPIVILTHRSRREAQKILTSIGLDQEHIQFVIAAEDLFLQGLIKNLGFGILSKGLKKSLALDILQKRLKVPPRNIAMIDDRIDNLHGLLDGGIGLAMLAPSEIAPDRKSITTFDHEEMIACFQRWKDGAAMPNRTSKLSPRNKPIAAIELKGRNTRKEGLHFFNLLRYVVRNTRLFVESLSR